MSAASIPVSDELYREISLRAKQSGVSAQDWISAVLKARVHIERQTDDFFKMRAANGSSLPLGSLLDKAPDQPPELGDEFEP